MNIIQLKIGIEFECLPKYELAYRLYSYLLSRIDKDYGDHLHRQEILAVSQYLDIKNGMWNISFFDDEAYERFIPIINERKYDLENCGTARAVSVETHYSEPVVGLGAANNKIRIAFGSPTAFKSNGQYMNYPTAEHIVRSAVRKWRLCGENLMDDETLQYLADNIQITDYRLRSTLFKLKKAAIPAFMGEVTLKSQLDNTYNRVLNSVMEFAQYSGIGIKTTLGMGGTTIIR